MFPLIKVHHKTATVCTLRVYTLIFLKNIINVFANLQDCNSLYNTLLFLINKINDFECNRMRFLICNNFKIKNYRADGKSSECIHMMSFKEICRLQHLPNQSVSILAALSLKNIETNEKTGPCKHKIGPKLQLRI